MAEISPAILEDEKQDRNGSGAAGISPIVRGAARVRLCGALNADGTPSAINGDYVRTDELANDRHVYVKVGKARTSMWYYSVAAGRGSHQRQWVVGPTAKVGSEKMWAYSERPDTSHGPEIGPSDTWSVYCYQTQQWVRQSGVTIMDLEEQAREIEARQEADTRFSQILLFSNLAATEEQEARTREETRQKEKEEKAPAAAKAAQEEEERQRLAKKEEEVRTQEEQAAAAAAAAKAAQEERERQQRAKEAEEDEREREYRAREEARKQEEEQAARDEEEARARIPSAEAVAEIWRQSRVVQEEQEAAAKAAQESEARKQEEQAAAAARALPTKQQAQSDDSDDDEEERLRARTLKRGVSTTDRLIMEKEGEEERAREEARKQEEQAVARAEQALARKKEEQEAAAAKVAQEEAARKREEDAAAAAKAAQEEEERQRMAKEKEDLSAREEALRQLEEQAAAAMAAREDAEGRRFAEEEDERRRFAEEEEARTSEESRKLEQADVKAAERKRPVSVATEAAPEESARRSFREEQEVFALGKAKEEDTVTPAEPEAKPAQAEPTSMHVQDVQLNAAILAHSAEPTHTNQLVRERDAHGHDDVPARVSEREDVSPQFESALVPAASAGIDVQSAPDNLALVPAVSAEEQVACHQAANDAKHEIAQHDPGTLESRVLEEQQHGDSSRELAVVKIQSHQRGIRDRTETEVAKAAGVLPGQLRESAKSGTLLSVDEAMTVFEEMDVNRNGEISQIELIKALRCNHLLARRLGLPSQIRQEDESRRIMVFMYAEMDKDHSRGVSLQEFLEYFAGQPAASRPEATVTPETSWDSAMNSEDEWDPEMFSGLASSLLESSVSNLKSQGLVVSISASEATNSSGNSPLSRPASRPMSARPSRPMSALPFSRPGSRGGKTNLLVAIDGDKRAAGHLEAAQALHEAEEPITIPPFSKGAEVDDNVTKEVAAAQDVAEPEALDGQQVSADNLYATPDDDDASKELHGAKDIDDSGAPGRLGGGDQDETVEIQWSGHRVLSQAGGAQDEAAQELDAPEDDAMDVQLEVIMNMEFADIQDSQEDFCRELCIELCYAYSVNADTDKMVVLNVHAGSVVAWIAVQTGVSAVGDTPQQVAEELISQFQEEDSALRAGKFGRLIVSLRLISKDEMQQEIERKREEEAKKQQEKPMFVRNPSVAERENMKRIAIERFMSLEDGQGIDILDFQNSCDEESGAEILDLRSEPSQPDEQNLGPIVSDAYPTSPTSSPVQRSLGQRVPMELSAEQAAQMLQRCLRGMIDRIFFRKYQKVVVLRRREELQKEFRRDNREASLADMRKTEIVVSIPQIDPDGYMSKATLHRIQQRGEPLEKADVARKAKKIITKKFAAVEVTTPGYGFVWNIGQVRQINWKMSGSIHVERVGIYLYLDGEPIHTIVKAVPNVGKYIFTLPETFHPAEEVYQILVIAEDPKLPSCHAFSAPFTVVAHKAGQLAKVPPTMPTITVTFPVRGGWCWPTGASYVLAWKSSGVVQNVQIDMLRHGEVVMRIATSLLNCGAFPFSMPPDAQTGEGFQIRVRSVALKKACGLSSTFSIIDRQVAQAVPRRVPSERVRIVERIGNKNPRLLAPLSPTPALRHTWSAVDARETDNQLATYGDERARTVGQRNLTQTGGWSPSRPRGQIHTAPHFDADDSHLEMTAPLQGGGTGRSIGRGGGSGEVLIPNGNLGTPAVAHSSRRSMSNEVGHFALDVDTRQKPSKFAADAEDDVIAVENVGEPDFETVYNRLRSKYSAQERATGVWLKPEIERFAGKSEEILRPNASTQHMMARSLAGTPQLSDVNLHGLSSRKKSRAGKHASRQGARSADPALSGSDTASSYQLHKGQQPIKSQFIDSRSSGVRADREKIISGAEEFLQMRDEIFAKQLAVLKQENLDRSATLESQKHGNSTGRYTPVMLPAVDTRDNSLGASTFSTSRGGGSSKRPHTFGTMSEEVQGKDEYRRYDSVRVRQGVANQAIADYYDSVQNKLYGMPPIV